MLKANAVVVIKEEVRSLAGCLALLLIYCINRQGVKGVSMPLLISLKPILQLMAELVAAYLTPQ
jgi:hypothetical protein